MAHLYEFAGPLRPIVVRSALALDDQIPLYLSGWPWRRVEAATPDLEIATPEGWSGDLRVVGRPDLTQRGTSPLETASALIDMLVRLCLEQLGPYADLHAGSALIDGRLVVMPGPSLAGKSTLALQLAERGHVLGGDDRLLIGPLDDASQVGSGIEGLTLGLKPRIRLPVHDRAGAAFAAYVGARLMQVDGVPEGMGFLTPRAGEAAVFGQRAPIAVLVLPVRRGSGGVGLEPAASSDIMRQLLEQTHAPHLPVSAVVKAAQALARGVPGFVLNFDDSAKAAAAIEGLARNGFRDGER